MDTIQNSNLTTKTSRTFHHHPLLNLVLLTSILSKLAYGKTYPASPWLPFRPVFGYLPHPPIWYPIYTYPHNRPTTNQQQIIHIHDNTPVDEALVGDGNVDPSNGYDLSPPNTNVDQSNGYIPPPNNNIDHIATSSTNNKHEVYDGVDSKSNNVREVDLINQANDTENEIFQPVFLYEKPKSSDKLTLPSVNTEPTTANTQIINNTEVATEFADENRTTTIKYPDEITTTDIYEDETSEADVDDEITDSITTDNNLLMSTLVPDATTTPEDNYFIRTTITPDYDVAESNIDQQADSTNVNRRKVRPNDNEDYGDSFEVIPVRRQKPNNYQQQKYSRPRPYKNTPSRINSKKGQYYDNYDDDYASSRPYRRTPANTYHRRTTQAYDFNEYEESRPYINRKKTPNRYGQRRRTTPAYDDYYEDVYDDQKEFYDEDYSHNNRQKPLSKQKETTTTEAATTTTTEATTTTTETTTTEESTTLTTTTEGTTPPTPPPSVKPTSGYPYYGNSGYGNISITYGPPTSGGGGGGGNNNQHTGYGPSNGNEFISITYGPPTGPNISPILETWYNQYAKSSVIKRIQDLLTPNNFYGVQYEPDKVNYNDGVF